MMLAAERRFEFSPAFQDRETSEVLRFVALAATDRDSHSSLTQRGQSSLANRGLKAAKIKPRYASKTEGATRLDFLGKAIHVY